MKEVVVEGSKNWNDKCNTMGYIPGKADTQVVALRQVLEQLPAHGSSVLEWRLPDGKVAAMVCEKLCKTQLAAQGLVERVGASEWHATSFAREWLNSGNDFSLAVHLHNNVKFFGELLASVSDDTDHADLLQIARESYGLNWGTRDQVRRRTGWLRSLGMIELWGQRVVRTDLGDELLSKISVCASEEALNSGAAADDAELDENQVKVLNDLIQVEQVDLRNRKALIGYIPRGVATIDSESESALGATEAIRKLIDIVGSGISVEEFYETCSSELGISRSSFTTTMHALRHTGLIERTSINSYSLHGKAPLLTQEGNEKLLVAYMHVKYLFFGEIIRHLDDPATSSALVAIARDDYGFVQATNSEIRLRLGFLQDAGLVERVDWQRFRSTQAGKRFIELLPLQNVVVSGEETQLMESDAITARVGNGRETIASELQIYGNDAKSSSEFEAAVGRAFALLGFTTEHLGGPGRTDVLCIAPLAEGDRYRIIVDAKCSGAGLVREDGVTFDVLRDHKKKHKADHVIVVGPEFAPRLKNWALENHVILLIIEDLITILENHENNPVSLTDFREMLARVDTFRDDLMERYQVLERRSSLMRKAVDLALQEVTDEDPIDEGYISVENMVYALRKEFSPRPSIEELREILSFLANPLVGALVCNKGRYRLVDSPQNLQLRLQGLGGPSMVE